VNAETGRHLFLRHLGQDHWRKPNKPLFTGGPVIDAGTLACHLCALGMRLVWSVGQSGPSCTGRRSQSSGRGLSTINVSINTRQQKNAPTVVAGAVSLNQISV